MTRSLVDRLSISSLARKDLFVCLGIWLAFELVCFVLPAFHLVQPESIPETWVVASFPIGIGGAFLMAASTQLTLLADIQRKTILRFLSAVIALLMSWIGLLGVAFPLFIVVARVLVGLFTLLKV